MKRLSFAMLVVVFGLASNASAYYPNAASTKLTEVITWATAGTGVIVGFANGAYCFFDSAWPNGKTLLTMATSAQISQRNVTVWCEDTTFTYAGFTTRNLVRLELNP